MVLSFMPLMEEAEKPEYSRWHPLLHHLALLHESSMYTHPSSPAPYPLEKFYIKLMTDWTNQLAVAISSSDCELLLGIPAYDDAGVGYHHPQVENISSALQGISAATRKKEANGIAIYCEWEMDENKWSVWRKFIQ